MRVLFVSPHAGLWVHSFPEALVADALVRRGHDIHVVRCGTMLHEHCVVMSANHVAHSDSDDKKRAVCAGCTKDARALDVAFRFPSTTLAAEVDAADEADVDALVARTSDKALGALDVDGVPIGRIACYELLLACKKSSLDLLDDAERATQRAHVKNALLTTRVATRVLDRVKPDRVVATNTLYSVLAVWRWLAERRGIAVYSLEAGPNLAHRTETIAISKSTNFDGIRALMDAWPSVRDVPCAPDELAAVTDHFVTLFGGRNQWAFSGKTDRGSSTSIRERFGFARDQKIVVAATSSPDEQSAALLAMPSLRFDAPCFQTQHEWIGALIDMLGDRKDVGLLVRVHPREFSGMKPAGPRAVPSENARRLMELLEHVPDNVKVNWPTDDVSLYDIASEASVFLTAWSSVAKEAALLGVPALGYAPQWTWYPVADLAHVAEHSSTYRRMLEAALDETYDIERVRRAYRWYAFEGVRAAFYVGDGYRAAARGEPAFVERAARRALWGLSRRSDRPLDLALRRPLAAGDAIERVVVEGARSRPWSSGFHDALPAATHAEETVALKRELRRLARALGGDRPRPGTLPARILDAVG